jgi:hypothetical protein
MVIDAPPNLVHWHRAIAVRFDGPRTYIRLDCDHERLIVLAPEMERDPAKLLRTGSRFPCRVCAATDGDTRPAA